ncbi:MAG: hypothetical protein EA355_10370 [Rhodobacteraceae bacterium]|nr:MAG: hypothetical protein EA355_10370 [Paracoccaceae bacterium]
MARITDIMARGADPLAPEATLSGTFSGVGFGMAAALGVGLGRTTGAEPWIAGALALALLGFWAAPRAMALRAGGAAALAGWRDTWAGRETAAGLAALGVFLVHLLLWLGLGERLWPLGLAVAGLALLALHAQASLYATRADVACWSQAPTVLMVLVLAAAGGMLGLSAVEGLLGFPPSLVVWKAAISLIAAGLTAQLWSFKAAEVRREDAAPLLDAPFFGRGRAQAGRLRWAALVLGVVAPLICAMLADATTERVLMPLAFALHLAGALAFRWLFLAEAQRA